jgi:hypothetical protein
MLFGALLLSSLWVSVAGASVSITPIDLTQYFYADPSVSINGPSSATLAESALAPAFPGDLVALLQNLPPLDQQIPLPVPGTTVELMYDYNVSIPNGNLDVFNVFIVKPSIPGDPSAQPISLLSHPGLVGSGSATFDLSSLLTEQYLGVSFELDSSAEAGNANAHTDSTVTVSDVKLVITTPDTGGGGLPPVIPEPSSFLIWTLVGLGMAIVGLRARGTNQST